MAVIPVSSPAEPKVTDEDRSDELVMKNMEEVASGFKVDAVLAIYAKQHAANPAVKRFARSFGKRSSGFNAKLKDVGSKEDFSIPASIIPFHEKSLDVMKGKRKALFDAAYLEFLPEHLALRKAATASLVENAQTPGLSAFAKEYISYLKDAEGEIKRIAGRK